MKTNKQKRFNFPNLQQVSPLESLGTTPTRSWESSNHQKEAIIHKQQKAQMMILNSNDGLHLLKGWAASETGKAVAETDLLQSWM